MDICFFQTIFFECDQSQNCMHINSILYAYKLQNECIQIIGCMHTNLENVLDNYLVLILSALAQYGELDQFDTCGRGAQYLERKAIHHDYLLRIGNVSVVKKNKTCQCIVFVVFG